MIDSLFLFVFLPNRLWVFWVHNFFSHDTPDLIWTKKSREYLSYPNPLFQNTAEDARVMSWWDYGYQIAGMANRTTLGKSVQIKIICISTTKFYTSRWKNKYVFFASRPTCFVSPTNDDKNCLFAVDNNTWNNSHIALVGKAMSSNESAAYEIMTDLDVDYVLGKIWKN